MNNNAMQWPLDNGGHITVVCHTARRITVNDYEDIKELFGLYLGLLKTNTEKPRHIQEGVYL